MKNLSQRSKIVLAIVGVLVVVVIAVAVFAQVGGSELFGATTPPVISPANPRITVGQTVTLNTMNMNCTWSATWTGSQGTQPVTLNPVVGALTAVRGVNVGSQTVIAKCNTGQTSTTVTVVAPPTPTPAPTPTLGPMAISPANPTISVGQKLTLTVINKAGTCGNIAEASNYGTVTVQNISDGVAEVTGRRAGTNTMYVQCGNRSSQTNVTVTP